MRLKITTKYELLEDEEVLKTYEIETAGECNALDSFQSLVDINEGKLGAIERKLALDVLDGFDRPCKLCGGTGEVESMEKVWPNEPHMAAIGTKKCICTTNKEFEE